MALHKTCTAAVSFGSKTALPGKTFVDPNLLEDLLGIRLTLPVAHHYQEDSCSSSGLASERTLFGQTFFIT